MEKMKIKLLIAQLFVLALGSLQVVADHRGAEFSGDHGSEAAVMNLSQKLNDILVAHNRDLLKQKTLLKKLSMPAYSGVRTALLGDAFASAKQGYALISELEQMVRVIVEFFNRPENRLALTDAKRSELMSLEKAIELLKQDIVSNLNWQERLRSRLSELGDPERLSLSPSEVYEVARAEKLLEMLQQNLVNANEQLSGAINALQTFTIAPEVPVYAPPVPGKAPVPAPAPEVPVYAPPVPGKAPVPVPAPEVPVYAPLVAGKAPVPVPAPEVPVYAPPVPGKAPVPVPAPEVPVYAPPVPGKAPVPAPAPEVPVYAPLVPGKAPVPVPAPEVPVYAPLVPGKAPVPAPAPEVPVYAPPVPGKAPALADAPVITERVELPAAVPAKQAVASEETQPRSLLEQIRTGIKLKSVSERVLAEPRDDINVVKRALVQRRQVIDNEDIDDDEDISSDSDEVQSVEERPAVVVRRAPRSGKSVDIFERLQQQRQFVEPSGQVDTDEDEDWD